RMGLDLASGGERESLPITSMPAHDNFALRSTLIFLIAMQIDAAVRWASDNKAYFFSQGQAIVYSDDYEAEENVFSVSEIASGFPTHIQAAVRWFGRGRSFYFHGCFVYKLNERRKRLRRGNIRRLGLPCDVNAAVNTGQEVLVFKGCRYVSSGCRYWRIGRNNSRRASPGGNNSDLGLPCDVNAALAWHNGTVYVVKDDVIWTPASEESPARSVHIDAWSLCSWDICEGNSRAELVEELQDNHTCNGDRRFCSLRFDQTTLAGSHNAGSGFDTGTGFMLFGCWIRNHGLSVLEQLRLGVRYLDVDPGWEQCGLLGTYHNFVCGGPVCRMLKQVKQFLSENRHEVVAINFNHEMTNHDLVLPALIRHVTSQLHQYLNSHLRTVGMWPDLGHAVRSNKRLFVIIDDSVEQLPSYRTHWWIHSERLLRSTWRGDVSVGGDCDSVLVAARRECERKAGASLLEVAIFGTSTSCVTTIADLCLPLVHEVARDCGKARHVQGKAPNVLLVDYPERATSEAGFVTSAAYFQNIRNLARLRQDQCEVRLDSAIKEPGNNPHVVIFSGPRAVLFNWETKLQEPVPTRTVTAIGVDQVDASFLTQRADGLEFCSTTGCDLYCSSVTNPTNTTYSNLSSLGLPCNMDAAFTKGTNTYLFKGCQYWQRSADGHVTGPQPTTDFSLPCDLSAALRAPDGKTYFFKGENYWSYTDEGGLSTAKDILDWSADFLHCD
ncbi:hypothetical protein BaRGS_00011763, partial [Batillaria attramentaria]